MLGTLLSESRHSSTICREKCSACNDRPFPKDEKAIADSSKLVRESKETVDGLVKHIDDSNFRFKTYSLQCSGASCTIASTELVSKGLYVTSFQDSFTLPANVPDWENMEPTMIALLTIHKELTQCANKILQSYALQTPSTTDKAFNRSSFPKINDKLG
jgi:hypothetical protein